ncbi:hypothetical protein [Pseudonocardia yuanmonensis]
MTMRIAPNGTGGIRPGGGELRAMSDRDVRRWPLRGFWRAWYWISWLISVVLFLPVLGLAVLAWRSSGPARWFPLLPGLVLLAIILVIGWQLATTALVVTVDAGGELRARLLFRARQVHATGVLSVRRSALTSGHHTPIVIRTANWSVRLIHTRTDVDELVAKLRRHNPALLVDV